MKRKLTLLIVLALTLCLVLAFSSCGENTDTDTNTETETETPNGSEPDTSTDTSADTETESNTDTETETESDTDTEKEEPEEHKHTEAIIPAVAPTCTETGLTEGKKCTVCGKALVAQAIVNALGHNYEDGYCTVCGQQKPYTRVDEDTIEFGMYPQTEVTDSTLVSTLNSLAGTKPTSSNSYNWTSYGYYISGSVSNYMWYVDVENDGEMYRGVYFTSYRPSSTTNGSSAGNTKQDENGYTTSNIYWFKYEPISWTILNESNGTALILCDMIIDSQQFDYDGSYYNDYAESTIRKWLNETFYNTAFNDLQKKIILTTKVDNSVASTGYSSNPYACEDTEDKVFLLSYQELTTYYLITNASRMKKTTDYAKSQGTSTSSSYLGNCYWWLRSPSKNYSGSARIVGFDGYVGGGDYVYVTCSGVVPALQIQL